jgi:hypothetical protein
LKLAAVYKYLALREDGYTKHTRRIGKPVKYMRSFGGQG